MTKGFSTKLLKWFIACVMSTPVIVLAQSLPAPPSSPVPGGIYVWAIPDGASDIRFKDRPVFQQGGYALVGISIKSTPGSASLSYQLDGESHQHAFEVSDKRYTEQRLTIKNRAMVTPPEHTLKRISDETTRQRKLYRSYTGASALPAGFVYPAEGITSSLFGHRRILNGQPRSPHSGMDIAADTGTPIVAAAAGTVVLAEPLYFSGEAIFIDHGQGLITMYGHLSERIATLGQQVEQGEVIGLVGATGRVTGPHLHWTVSLNGERVDPEAVMAALNKIAGVPVPPRP